jgi:tetrahydromethanopterin S-methyltransferase subunit G
VGGVERQHARRVGLDLGVERGAVAGLLHAPLP